MPVVFIWIAALCGGIALRDNPTWFNGAHAIGSILFWIALVALALVALSLLDEALKSPKPPRRPPVGRR